MTDVRLTSNPRVRPDLLRRLHGAEPLRRHLPARRRPDQHGRHRHHPAAGGGEHDRDLGSADGRDRRPARRHGDPAAGHPDRRGGRHGRQGQGLPSGLRHGRVGDPAHARSAKRCRCCPSGRTALVVVVEDGRPLGTVTEADALGVDRFAQVHEVMSSDLLTVIARHRRRTTIFDALTGRHLDVALVVRDDLLVGVMTRKQAVRSTLYRPALDAAGRLMVGAAVGINGDVAGRTERLLGRRDRRAGRGHRARSPGEDAVGAASPYARSATGRPRPRAGAFRWSPATSSRPTASPTWPGPAPT